MPAYPDATHPKFLEGDEMVPPRTAPAVDDVEGHSIAPSPTGAEQQQADETEEAQAPRVNPDERAERF